ncbi:hypothetical protein QWZ08_00540 [Ferruginibacter paludis]|uniref:DUF6799 domain-containing protein n=1 Tax=Ferruginibacter paludis TaxID=1310417 RepID=UPI0025B5AD8F|nr:DUF6799 domain-containing protein [Ferruginibacter paludis]MDN3654089.1 hypothetical protein [Ferruginibacter paludis]
MKKLLIIAIAFTLGGTAFAQEKMDKIDHKMSHKMGMKKDCVMMKDGKMMMMKNGKMMAMDKDMTMHDGTVCMMDGTCKMKDGTTMMMKEGETCDMDGKMSHMKMGKGMKHKM